MKIAVASFAHVHAAGWASDLAARPGIEVVAADPDDPARGADYAEQFGIRLVADYDALFAERPAGVLVCTENVKHRAVVEQAAAAGCHVLCEKPLATTLADARAMLETCERAGVRLSTAFPVRFSPPIRALLGMVAEGRLGRIHAVTGTNPGYMPGDARAWFVDPELAGGGSMMDHTVHVADLLRAMLGSEAVEVYAQHNRLLYPDLPVETAGTVMVTFADETVATIDCSWSRPASASTWGTVSLEAIGEDGAVTADAFGQTVDCFDDTSGKGNQLGFGSNIDAAMLDEFLASLVEDRPMTPSGHDGYQAMEIALAGYRSAETGQPVRLPLEA